MLVRVGALLTGVICINELASGELLSMPSESSRVICRCVRSGSWLVLSYVNDSITPSQIARLTGTGDVTVNTPLIE